MTFNVQRLNTYYVLTPRYLGFNYQNPVPGAGDALNLECSFSYRHTSLRQLLSTQNRVAASHSRPKAHVYTLEYTTLVIMGYRTRIPLRSRNYFFAS